MNTHFKSFLDLPADERRTVFGFTAERLNTLPSYIEKDFWINQLNHKASEYIQGVLTTTLQAELHDCKVTVDPDDEMAMTLLVEYQSLYPSGSEVYIQPRIKLEGGARSAVEPHSTYTVTPYIHPDLEDYELSVPNLITIDAERTFLDKVVILHGWYCGYRDEGRLPTDKDRLSRHYYDVATISATSMAEQAISNTALLNNVIEHAKLFFHRGWMKLDEAVTSGLKIVPRDALYKSLEKDYNAMQEMLFGDIPSFSSIVEHITELEKRLNES